MQPQTHSLFPVSWPPASLVCCLLQEFGLPQPLVVAAQAQPDPEFPTVIFPNPEEGEGTWQMAFDTGETNTHMGMLEKIFTDGTTNTGVYAFVGYAAGGAAGSYKCTRLHTE